MPSPGRTRTTLPLLFGKSLRNRVLVAVALKRPIRIARLSDYLKVDASQVTRAISDLVRSGLLCRTAEGAVDLASFCAAEELFALLRRLGDAAGGDAPRNNGTVPRQIDSIFGGKPRTGVVLALSVLGRIHEGDVARLLGIAHGSVRHAVQHLASEGIVRTIRESPFVFVELNGDFIAAKQLRALAQAIAAQVYDIAALRRLQEEIERERLAMNCPSDAPLGLERLVPFGDPSQRQLLLEIARRDVVSRPRLATLLRRTPDSVKGVLESLLRHKLVTTTVVGSGPQRRTWVALNMRHPLAAAIRDLAVSLSGALIVEHDARRPTGFPPIEISYKVGEVPACLPGEEATNAVVLSLRRGDPLDEKQIKSFTGVSKPHVVRILADLQGRGLVRLSGHGGRYRAAIASDQPWSHAVLRLLQEAETFIRGHYGGMYPRHRCMK